MMKTVEYWTPYWYPLTAPKGEFFDTDDKGVPTLYLKREDAEARYSKEQMIETGARAVRVSANFDL